MMCLRSDTELRCKNDPVLNSMHVSFQGEEDQCLQYLRRDGALYSEVKIFQFRVIFLRRASFPTYSKISRGTHIHRHWSVPLHCAADQTRIHGRLKHHHAAAAIPVLSCRDLDPDRPTPM